MKTANTNLVSFMGSAKQGMQFDLWSILLASGTMLRWTDADADITKFLSRASTATYTGADGLLKTAAVNEGRYAFDVVSKGLLIEAAATNLLGSSTGFAANWSNNGWVGWSDNFGVAPDGTMTTTRSVPGGTVYKSISVAASSVVTFSMFYKKAVGASVYLYADGGGILGGSTSVNLNLETLAFSAAGSSIQSFGLQDLGSFVRAYAVIKTSAAGGSAAFHLYPTAGVVEAWGAQVEAGSVVTAYIPTTIGPVTRAADLTRAFTRGPIIERERVRWVRGIEVDQLAVTLSGPALTVDGQPLAAFATAGGFDGATVLLERAYLNDAGQLQGTLSWFSGMVSDVEPTDMGTGLTVKSQLTQLNQQLPRNLYQAGCLNNLFDSNCGVNRAVLTQATMVVRLGSAALFAITLAGPSAADGYLTLGIAKFTSGANAGLSRSVLYQSGDSLVFSRPFPFPVSLGDRLTVTPGCNKTFATCANKFANTSRFRGVPFVPVPETVT